MKYKLTLQNGKTREIKILDKPLFACRISGEGNTKYKTLKQIENNPEIKIIDKNDPFYLFQNNIGSMRDEGAMFAVYKGLRNPIVKLERIFK